VWFDPIHDIDLHKFFHLLSAFLPHHFEIISVKNVISHVSMPDPINIGVAGKNLYQELVFMLLQALLKYFHAKLS